MKEIFNASLFIEASIMASLQYYVVDVFAQEKFTGNPVAVVLHETPLEENLMRQIASELQFPETSFVFTTPQENGGYDVRVFTPTREVTFSGHPTMGAAYVINYFLSPALQKSLTLNLKSRQITIDAVGLRDDARSRFVSKNKPILQADQKDPEFGHIFEPVLLSRVLNIEPTAIDKNFPIQEVTIGLGFIIVPIVSLEELKEITINKERYEWLIQRSTAKCILVFCKQTESPENQVHVRVFADYYNIPEDSATGSGNGCLAAYLVKYNFFGSTEVDLRVEQGYEIGRPSLIYAKATMKDNSIDVSIGGKITLVAQGEIFI